LADKHLTVKLADFGLAKIIGEESFTTTLCGTPSYVAPEILKPSSRRRYTRAVDIWSLGVVLYICLCGFPPFSDELYTPENPYTLAQQIIEGRYDFPSPYWDSVGDPALDLIERMLTVDADDRITVDECLEHPWTTGHDMGPAGESIMSADGLLAGRMTQLDVSRRGVQRERTLLSSLNEITITKIIEDDTTKEGGEKLTPVKVFEKNKSVSQQNGANTYGNGHAPVGPSPSGVRFLAMGERGDVPLFTDDADSIYPEGESFRKLEDE
jgi:serine/threonine-protein kinase Chk2